MANSNQPIKISLDKRILNEFASKIRNEERINEVVDLKKRAKSEEPLEEVLFNCECDDAACVETISMSTEMYARTHRKTKQFVAVLSHIRADIEVVKDRLPTYAVVEKFFPFPQSKSV